MRARASLTTGDLFATCPYDVTGTSVEPVLDSSRYFVLRVESEVGDAGKRKAYIGLGVRLHTAMQLTRSSSSAVRASTSPCRYRTGLGECSAQLR